MKYENYTVKLNGESCWCIYTDKGILDLSFGTWATEEQASWHLNFVKRCDR